MHVRIQHLALRVLRVAAGLSITAGLLGAAVPAGGAARVRAHLLVDISGRYVIGGVIDGRYVKGDVANRAVRAPYTLQTVRLSGLGGVTTAPQATDGEAPCDAVWNVELPQSLSPGIAVSSPSWRLLPRRVERLDPNAAPYVDAVRARLARNGITNTPVRIRDLVRTDLDGDGKLEVVVSAAWFATDDDGDHRYGGGYGPGDYSIVFVRRLVGSTVTEVPVEEHYFTDSGRFAVDATLAAIADLDGDGRMEVVVDGRLYEGRQQTVYALQGTRAVERVSEACEA